MRRPRLTPRVTTPQPPPRPKARVLRTSTRAKRRQQRRHLLPPQKSRPQNPRRLPPRAAKRPTSRRRPIITKKTSRARNGMRKREPRRLQRPNRNHPPPNWIPSQTTNGLPLSASPMRARLRRLRPNRVPHRLVPPLVPKAWLDRSALPPILAPLRRVQVPRPHPSRVQHHRAPRAWPARSARLTCVWRRRAPRKHQQPS